MFNILYSESDIKPAELRRLVEEWEQAHEEPLCISVTTAREIFNDPVDESDCLLDDYLNATIEQRSMIDYVFIRLTGWSLPTLVQKAMALLDQ